MTGRPDLETLARVALAAAEAGGRAALAHFRAPALVTDDKGPGAFDPVTAADREAEAAIRAALADARPDDAVRGEEEADRPGTSGFSWIVDPVDGTRAFISGLPTWGVLVALDDGEAWRVGVVAQPFTGETFLGVVDGACSRAELHHAGASRALSVRACRDLASATLYTTSPQMFGPAEWPRFERVAAEARLTRYGVDCYAYALLALGQIDLVIEAGLAPYDIAAPAALVRAAGGIVTDWRGGDCRAGGQVIAAGDARTHAAALALLAG